MHKVEPQVFLIGETRIVEDGLAAYLEHIGAPEWQTTAPTDVEKIVEVYGRLCYRSWKPGMNPNVTKVREGNDTYLSNILSVKHGSVVEHGFINFIFADVSRVFTHELVRHRVGTAISQESLRFVRLDKIGFWAPSAIREEEKVMTIFSDTVEYLEKKQIELAEYLKLDAVGEDGKPMVFHDKKVLTSAMRRIAPEGLSTTIGWSVNPRTLRWCLEARTNRSAEEEIRLVFGKVAEIVIRRYPNLFGDFTAKEVEGLPEYTTLHSKI